MTLADIIYESRRLAKLRRMGWKVGNVEPEEIPWCPDCGASLEFCECNTASNYESEKEEL